MTSNKVKSIKILQQSNQLISGGVNSPVRSFSNVDAEPIVISRGEGAYLFDVDGNKYLDFINSWGAMILGHCHPKVVQALISQSKIGLSFGATTALEPRLAALIKNCMPSIELLRMVSTGTEACMSAVRLARGFTGKNKIIKFIGCYHGHSDSLLTQAGSGLLTHSVPDSAGIPKEFVQHTITLPFNNLDLVKQAFVDWQDDIAAIIVEPILANMNVVMPHRDFLQGLRNMCSENKSLLIFDEVITGFRVGLNGVQGLFNIQPDLTCLGKIMGGGLPAAAFGGRRDVMECLAPLGSVYQAGTLSGNPLAMSAGIATLEFLQENSTIYGELEKNGASLVNGLQEIFARKNISLLSNSIGGLAGFKFISDPNNKIFKKFFKHMLANGVYLPPSAFEAVFLSICHTPTNIEYVLSKAQEF